MKPTLLAVAGLACVSGAARAVDYHVDFTRMQDYEQLRPIIEQCKDYDALELYREKLQRISNLNEMREVFENAGFGLFNDCPAGITGEGIEPVKDRPGG